jgi:hypothetical protein
MAYSASKNQLFHERVKNYAVAMQNLREEGDRLKDWYFQEITGNEFFVNTDTATTAEIGSMVNYITDFEKLNTNEAVAADARRISLIPFLPNAPAN